MAEWIDESVNSSSQRFDNAIVFVHGLNGSRLTWAGKPDRFIDRLKTEADIYDNGLLWIC